MSSAVASSQSHPLLVVLSGPSGVGKDAVLALMRRQQASYFFAVTATTRAPRDTERDGLDYIFFLEGRFRRMIADGELLEWAEVYGNLYGVPRRQVADALRDGRDVILKVDVQGAATIRRLAPEALLVFLAPPSMDELARRLSLRMTESSQALRTRIRTAEAEMEAASEFDYTVVNHNGRLDAAVHEIEGLVARERARVPPRVVEL